MNSSIMQLRNLLLQNRSNSLAQKCLNESWDIIRSIDALPTDEIRDTYTRRAELNDKMSGSVEGYDYLLKTLNTDVEELVTIHILHGQNESFMVFSNSSITKLFGVLVSKNIDPENDNIK